MTAEVQPLVAPSRPLAGRKAAPLLAACVGAVAGVLMVLAVRAGLPSAQFTTNPVALRPMVGVAQPPAPVGQPLAQRPPSQGAQAPAAPRAVLKTTSTAPPLAPVVAFPSSASVAAALGVVGAAILLAWRALGSHSSVPNGVVAMAAAQSTKGNGDRKDWAKDSETELQGVDMGRRTPIGRLRNRVNSLFGRRLAELEAFRMDPFSLADQLLADVQAEFQDFRTSKDALWHPSVDVRETPEAITFHCDLPGISKENIQIDLTRDRLTISGRREKRSEKQGDKKEEWYYTERSFGAFSRSFGVPPGTTRKDVTAAYKDGVLEVTVKKQPPAKEEDTPILIQ